MKLFHKLEPVNQKALAIKCGTTLAVCAKSVPAAKLPQSGEDAGRFTVRADEKLTAFLELKAAIRTCGELS